jgi:hypothetical protein
MLAVLWSAPSAAAEPATPMWHTRDAIHCGYHKGPIGADAVSAETVDSFLKRFVTTFPMVAQTSTAIEDPMGAIDFSVSKNFLGHIGGGGGAKVLYDPVHRILAVCSNFDSGQALYVVPNVPTPPFTVAHADLSSFATEHGLRLGSSATAVEHVYGRAPLVALGRGDMAFAYKRFIPTGAGFSPFGVYTYFVIKQDKVSAITRITGF